MFDYLQQFKSLPQDLRDQVSSPSAMAILSDLEKKYQIDLATTVMKVMAKIVDVKNLNLYFTEEFGLGADKATALAGEMKEKIFFSVADYLGLSSERRAWDLNQDIDKIIAAAGLTIASGLLVGRFKNILATYLRGVRDKIDTKNSLAKDVKIGGLNLSLEEIERVMKICATNKISGLNADLSGTSFTATAATASTARTDVGNLDANGSVSAAEKSLSIDQSLKQSTAVQITPSTRLDKIIAGADQGGAYDLKRELASGRLSKTLKADPSLSSSSGTLDTGHELPSPVQPDNAHQISPPATKLDLPAPSKSPVLGIPQSIPGPAVKTADINNRPSTSTLRSTILQENKSFEKALDSQLGGTPSRQAPAVGRDSSKSDINANELKKDSPLPSKAQAGEIGKINSLAQSPRAGLVKNSNLVTAAPLPTAGQISKPAQKKNNFFSFLSFKSKGKTLQTVAKTVQTSHSVAAASSAATAKTAGALATASSVGIAPSSAAVVAKNSIQTSPSAPVSKSPVSAGGSLAAAPVGSINKPTPALQRPAAPTSTARPQIHDIRPMPKVMGPLEELQFLDPLNFRRLNNDPVLAVNKIFSKIKLLEKDGYDKMVLGVKAWRQSPVNRLYVQLGQEALISGKTLAEVLQKQEKNHPRYLSMEEFLAISSLNSKLIF